jgi:hypothetical protein
MNYVGPGSDDSYYGVDHMRETERYIFLSLYETSAKIEIFDDRRVLGRYCQTDVTLLRKFCRRFRKEILQIGNLVVFLECMSIALACNKMFRKKFLQPDTVGIFPIGGHIWNMKQTKVAITWLLPEKKEGPLRKKRQEAPVSRTSSFPTFIIRPLAAWSLSPLERNHNWCP